MEVFGKVNLEVGVPVKELNDLNMLVAPNFQDARGNLFERRVEASNKVWPNLQHKENMLRKN